MKYCYTFQIYLANLPTYIQRRLFDLTMRYAYITIVCVLISSPLSALAQNATFPDPNLAAAVDARLRLTNRVGFPHPQTSLAVITSLSANRKGITDLTGLEHLTGLVSLQLRGNPIGDFTPISSLTNLQTLNLINTGFTNSDISILEPLVNLKFLFLSNNRISDLKALVNVISMNMPNLATLSIASNTFCGITPLTDLKNQLTGLNLNYIQISDFGPLAEFTNLIQLDLQNTGISNLEPLSGLTNLRSLFLDDNQITDLSSLSSLTNLTLLWACWNPFPTDPNLFESLRGSTAMRNFSVDTTYKTQARVVFSAAAQGFCDPARASFAATYLGEIQNFCSLLSCGLGWAPQSQYQHALVTPKVMIYALEFEYDPARNAGFTCKTIEIRMGDDSIENLAGWKLYLGIRYNPSHIPITIPEEHSHITDRILRLTPEMLGLETFGCSTAYLYGLSHPLPSVHYVLKTDENVVADTAYSCFAWDLDAYTTVNGINVESQRRISSAALREMAPRVLNGIS